MVRSRLLGPLTAVLFGVALGCSGKEPPLARAFRVSALPGSDAIGREAPRADPRAAAPPPPAPSPPTAPSPEPGLPAHEADQDQAQVARELLATAREVIVYRSPSRSSEKVGYLRLGARVARDADSAGNEGCRGGWYRIAPYGFVCAGPAASIDPEEPLAVLAARRPAREDALPYAYGRAKGVPPPLYRRLPTPEQQRALEGRVPARAAGFEDLPSSPTPEALLRGDPVPSPLGFARDPASVPARALPDAGFALLDVYEHDGRRFGLTTELDLVPLDRLARIVPSTFHGLALDATTTLPVAFVRSRHGTLYEPIEPVGVRPARPLAFREAFAVAPEPRTIGGLRFLVTAGGALVRADDVQVVGRPEALPPWATGSKSWIHVSIGAQTLVLYAGATPTYVTLVSTGSGLLGDPQETHATPRGEFRIHTKHVAVTMTGEEVGDEFDLGDVPYVQYFTDGYAFHAAYWHDAFGAAHSHGCVNLAPLDARALFHATEPAVPQAWHGAYSHEGTLVSITP